MKKSLFEVFCFGLVGTWRLPLAPVKKTPLADPVCCFGVGVVTWSLLLVKKSLAEALFYYVCFLLVEET